MAGPQPRGTITRTGKPGGRGYRAPRCPRCRAQPALCFCAHITRLECRTPVSVVMHFLEEPKPTNTAQLAVQALSSGRLVLRGAPGLEFHAPTLLEQVPARAYLLHPTPDAIPLDETSAARLPRPLHLVVPDGTWGQTRRLVRREAALRALPALSLPAPPSGRRYPLRRVQPDDGVCTLEAIARALGLLESPELERQLLALLAVAVERALLGRGARVRRDSRL